jgi:hypothetical protein
MENSEKLKYVLDHLECLGRKNESGVKSKQYLKDVIEEIKPKPRTKIEMALYDAELHLKAGEREVLIAQTIANERRKFVNTLTSIIESDKF